MLCIRLFCNKMCNVHKLILILTALLLFEIQFPHFFIAASISKFFTHSSQYYCYSDNNSNTPLMTLPPCQRHI
jgi:hypothetical protein